MLVEKLSGYKPGDILQLKFGTFKERPDNKLVSTSHMFLVVDELNVCTVSSQTDKVNDRYPYNIPINDWKEAHLNKPSHAKVDSYGEISDDNVFKKIGELTATDKENILSKFKNAPQHYLLEWVSDILKEEYIDEKLHGFKHDSTGALIPKRDKNGIAILPSSWNEDDDEDWESYGS